MRTKSGCSLGIALCTSGALLLSGCASDPSCEETRTCASGAVGTGGKTTDAASTGGHGSGTGGMIGTGGSTGSGGAGGGAGSGAMEGGTGTGGSGDAGDAADAGREAEAGPKCTGTPGLREEGCPIEDPNGIFVSAGAIASGADGSRAHPFASITAALKAISSAGDAGSRDGPDGSPEPSAMKRIYVCADGGAYTETLALHARQDASLDGLAFYGGFRCANWKYAPATKTKLTSSDTPAWSVSGSVKGITLEDFDVSSTDAVLPGKSSIAMVVNGAAKNVFLRRMNITAGRGMDGMSGASGTNGADGILAGSDQAGLAAACTNPPTSRYPGHWIYDGVSPMGGNGGAGWLNMNGERGVAGGPQTNVTPPNIDNSGDGAIVLGAKGSDGGAGSRGSDGASAAGYSAADAFNPVGYEAGTSAQGLDGFKGQGGGGGGSSKGSTTCAAPSGGAGGCGGFPGKHGFGGGSGGVSVALWVWDAEVTLADVTLVSGNGGNGGDGGNGGLGGKGQFGGPGGAGDTQNGIGAAGGGGRGGDGGNGGAGMGGNGGHSYPLVFHGTAPTKVGVIYTPGQPGLKGVGGLAPKGAATVRAPSGTDGKAAAEYEAP